MHAGLASNQECVFATPTKSQPTQQVGYRLVWTASSPRLAEHATGWGRQKRTPCFGLIISLTQALLDDMGTRIDDLEKNIAELMMQAGVDEAQDSSQLEK